ncbi:MAG: YihA family ribosome biogenesis GTP-binding protein [Alphaproteobacteria bacterium]|nr:YihA family ribosome biogenesis GTP-binding protein [Alphaproteobacteria bacterium]
MDFGQKDFSDQQIKKANNLFSSSCDFVISVAKLEQLPLTDMPEVAFAGRSNVGKSSLINAVCNKKGLAKTSSTPGRTQQLNYFNLNEQIHIVDLPGYGYAQAPEHLVKQWQKVIFAYLQGRVNLKRVMLLIDSRHGIKKVDKEVMEMLDKAAVTYQVVLTKSDKIGKDALAKVKTETEAEISKHAAAYTRVLTTSSEKKQGIEILRAEIASLI